jgi:hypothetical protein
MVSKVKTKSEAVTGVRSAHVASGWMRYSTQKTSLHLGWVVVVDGGGRVVDGSATELCVVSLWSPVQAARARTKAANPALARNGRLARSIRIG